MIWIRKWQPNLIFLPGKSHGQRSLAGYSPMPCTYVQGTKGLHSKRKPCELHFVKCDMSTADLKGKSQLVITGHSQRWLTVCLRLC